MGKFLAKLRLATVKTGSFHCFEAHFLLNYDDFDNFDPRFLLNHGDFDNFDPRFLLSHGHLPQIKKRDFSHLAGDPVFF